MTTQTLFNPLKYIDRLKAAGVDAETARAHAEAMEDALHESVATKADILELKIWIGGVAVVLFGALAGMKYFA